ncbi:MAG: hypothetical protein DRP09_08970 [Candidatus Thorarchaeota archaeon]|nr:MAG: hypothetical protein DRP09_08970 [Candidatus Thorarchaeota archaeon]
MMFNRRLQSSEADLWLDLYEKSTERSLQNRDAARTYLNSPNAVTYVTMLDNTPIGGTCVMRDPTRLAMLLSAVAIDREHRDRLTYSLVKSSLPFFRTVAIRDVDALVCKEGHPSLGFPYGIEQEPWIHDVLLRAGFKDEQELTYAQVDLDESRQRGVGLSLKPLSHLEPGRELVWEVGRKTGLANSATWTSLHFAQDLGKLYAVTSGEHIIMLTSMHLLGSKMIVGPVVHDSRNVPVESAAAAILGDAADRGADEVVLTMVGEGQRDLLDAFRDLTGSMDTREVVLMRKLL